MAKKNNRQKSSPTVEKKKRRDVTGTIDKPIKLDGDGAGKEKTDGAKSKDQAPKESQIKFPVVGIGASAGGFEAFRQLLEHMPSDTGMAFVVISHLAPSHESMLSELLSRYVSMSIAEAADGMLIQPDHIYVIPQNANIRVSGKTLRVSQRSSTEHHMPIDFFFRSLAQECGNRAIGVILSGTGSDGALGILAVKEAGGLTFSQDEQSAKYNSMPHSAIATGSVDFVLPPGGIARELTRIRSHPYVAKPAVSEAEELFMDEEDQLKRIFAMLRFSTGIDFSHYKQSTIKRRIIRRMALHRIENLASYHRCLQENQEEIGLLYRELLISVTNFFREQRSFDALKKRVFPAVVKGRQPDEPIRVWVPGCSTGEEVYSIAIALLEFLAERSLHFPVQIFATDVNEQSLRKARAGHYIENIIQDVSKERLRRFFVKTERGYEIAKSIRDLCIFAKQDITKDPPFSRMDIISCRNVLIYLGQALQKKVIPIFHYALRPKGYLILGTSETIGGFGDLFTLTDKKYKIYLKRAIPSRMQVTFSSAGILQSEDIVRPEAATQNKKDVAARSEIDIQREADRIVLNQYSPSGALVNENMEIIQFRGDVTPYLMPASGKASFNILKMAREGLLVELRTALNAAKRSGTVIIRDGITIKDRDVRKKVSLKVVPLKHGSASSEVFYLVLFEETVLTTLPAKGKKGKIHEPFGSARARREIDQLKVELLSTREYLQSIIEEQEATNEELKSANEEILSNNEELQSTNEELETAKEELQSTNEELQTVNEEVQNRNTELSQLNNDLTNLLASVNLPILMLGSDLRVRRFTPMAEKLMNLIPTDIGRPISDINTNLRIEDLDSLVAKVIDEVAVQEREVQDRDGHWYLLRVRPYKTPENRIDGAVLVLIGQDEMKGNRDELQFMRDYVQIIMDIARDPILIMDMEGMVKNANTAFLKSFKLNRVDTIDHSFYQLLGGAWDRSEVRSKMEALQSKNGGINHFEARLTLPDGSAKHVLINGRSVVLENEKAGLMLLSFEEYGAQALVEQELREKNRVLLQEVHHRVKNNLQIVSSLLNMQSRHSEDHGVRQVFLESDNRIRSMALIHEKLYQSQDFTRINFADYAQSLFSHLVSSHGAQAAHITMNLDMDKALVLGLDEAVPCGLLINELVSNAIRHAFPSGHKPTHGDKPEISVGIKADERVSIFVGDNGKGLPKEVDFETANSMGIRLVRMLTGQLGGTMQVRTNGGTDWKITFKNSVPAT